MKDLGSTNQPNDIVTKQAVEETFANTIPVRENSKAYVVGDRVLYAGKYSWALVCATPGTSAAAAPVWPASIVSGTTTLTDGTVVWTIYDMTEGGGGSGGSVMTATGYISAGSLTCTVTLPAGSTYIDSRVLDGSSQVLTGVDVVPATASTAGSVTFTIGAAYSNTLTCIVTFAGSGVHTASGMISVGNTSAVVTVPAGKTIVSYYALLGTREVMLGVDVVLPSASIIGGVTFSIAAPYTSAISCFVVYSD